MDGALVHFIGEHAIFSRAADQIMSKCKAQKVSLVWKWCYKWPSWGISPLCTHPAETANEVLGDRISKRSFLGWFISLCG